MSCCFTFQINDTTADWTGNSICPRGYFCPNGTDYPEPCPAGTYSLYRGMSELEDCLPCLPGRFCPAEHYTIRDSAPLCEPG